MVIPTSSDADGMIGELLKHAQQEIYDTYGDLVKLKAKTLLKFGRSDNIDNADTGTVMTLPGSAQRHETYVQDNLINRVVSSDASDNQLIIIEYHTIDPVTFLLTFGVQRTTLTGQTPVVLDVPCARVSRFANLNATNFAGTISVYESTGGETAGVPNTDTTVHAQVALGKNQSQKAATSVSSVDYLILTSVYAGIGRGNSSARVDLEIETSDVNRADADASGFNRLVTGTGPLVFRERFGTTVSSQNSPSAIPFIPYLVIRKNSDIRLTAQGSSNDIAVNASWNSYIATIQT